MTEIRKSGSAHEAESLEKENSFKKPKELAESLGYSFDQDESETWFKVYNKPYGSDGKVELCFQNSKLIKGGMRVSLNVWNEINQRKASREINLCQDEAFLESWKAAGLTVREDGFFVKDELERGGYSKIKPVLEEFEKEL